MLNDFFDFLAFAAYVRDVVMYGGLFVMAVLSVVLVRHFFFN
jgi:hypothetical protein